ncbi:MAG: UPF0149 family protein [Duodenibacillus sp.]
MTQHLTLEQIDQLGELLAGIPEPFVPMEADMLDGYLTAIALLKTPPALEDWLPLVFDVEGRNRAKLPDPQRQATLRKLILARGAEIEAQILAEKPIDPIIYDDEADAEDEFAALSPFADGFAFACSAWPELLKSEDKAVQAALVGILRYESQSEESEEDREVEEVLNGIEEEVAFADLDEALADLAACVQEIAEVTRQRDIESAKKARPARRR